MPEIGELEPRHTAAKSGNPGKMRLAVLTPASLVARSSCLIGKALGAIRQMDAIGRLRRGIRFRNFAAPL